MSTISKPTILVADTDATALAQTIRLLNRDDINVFSAVCYTSAISAAAKLELDLLLCDLTLWMGTPGQDLVRDIHKLPNRSDVPVIFTSTGQGADVIRRNHDFGGAYHIKKPINAKVLEELVQKALWLPHLVQSHMNRPHFILPSTSVSTTSINMPQTQ